MTVEENAIITTPRSPKVLSRSSAPYPERKDKVGKVARKMCPAVPDIEPIAGSFKPTLAMIRFIQVWGNIETDLTPTKTLLARRTGVTTTTLTSWLMDVGFQAWFQSFLYKVVKSDLDRIWLRIKVKALKGDLGCARLFIERFDREFKPVTRQEKAVAIIQLTAEDRSQIKARAKALARQVSTRDVEVINGN